MRKLSSIFFHLLLTALLCITASAQAKERTAPEITSQTLQAGQSYYVYTIRAEKRDELQAYLKAHNIGSAVYYPVPLYKQPAYAHLRLNAEDYPNAEKAAQEVLSIPMFPEITQEQVCRVCDTIRAFYEEQN